MDRPEAIAMRTRLKALLAKYEARTLTHHDEDEHGLLGNDTTTMRCAVLRSNIAELDRRIGELPARLKV